MKFDWNNEIKLAAIVKKSNSYTDVLRNIGFSVTGGNPKTLKKYIEKYNISIIHFETITERANRTIVRYHKKKELKDIFKISKFKLSPSDKKRIIGILKYKCTECDNKGYWNGKKLTLQIDHKNGNCYDHRKKNLRLLCPNCHSQTLTFAGKSANKKLVELDENGKVIFKPSEKHIEYWMKQRKVDRPDKEILKQMVDKFGYRATGKKFGVSDNAIRKWLRFEY